MLVDNHGYCLLTADAIDLFCLSLMDWLRPSIPQHNLSILQVDPSPLMRKVIKPSIPISNRDFNAQKLCIIPWERGPGKTVMVCPRNITGTKTASSGPALMVPALPYLSWINHHKSLYIIRGPPQRARLAGFSWSVPVRTSGRFN